jgi:hypothetical protein
MFVKYHCKGVCFSIENANFIFVFLDISYTYYLLQCKRIELLRSGLNRGGVYFACF